MEENSSLSDGLIRIHKLLTRALSVSVVKCDEYIRRKKIPENEAKGFILYLTTLVRVMHAHHMGEDDIVFPAFRERMEAPYDQLGNDHISMSNMLDDLEKNIGKISISDLVRIRKYLDTVQRLWAPHIKVEEESFSSAKINNKFSDREQQELSEKVGKHGAKTSGPGPLTLPFVLYNLESDDRKVFLKDFPWILTHFLIPIVWRNKWKPMDPFLLN